ncbi:MAG: endonuclease [Chitinophagaceae bacterium]|nr:endonuclease [Chitinophagaceae bacterium]
MPEGPSLIILAEQLKPFERRTVTGAGGYTDMPTAWIKGKRLLQIATWGKHLLLRFSTGTVRVHLRLFGSATINERKKVNASFFLRFGKDELNFYVVQTQLITEKLEGIYDWRTDVMDRKWRASFVEKEVKKFETEKIGDVLMNQKVFTGVGNIIRVETLYRSKIHPESIVGKIPGAVLKVLIRQARRYSKEFLQQRKDGTLAKNWEAYQQEYCHRDDREFLVKVVGKTKRKTYFCLDCQKLYK